MSQLPLALGLADHASFESFVVGDNESAVRHVRDVAVGRPDTLWLWGGVGVGKSHLLQAACRAANGAGKRAMYVPLPAHSPAILADLEQVAVLAIDDLDTVAGRPEWEEALFVILNAFLGRSGGLLLSASSAPHACGFALADLESRAAGAVNYRLAALSDDDRRAALCLHAAARGLKLGADAADYLLKRVDRDMTALRRWLDRLDRESLSAQRRLTIPFIRQSLARDSARDE